MKTLTEASLLKYKQQLLSNRNKEKKIINYINLKTIDEISEKFFKVQGKDENQLNYKQREVNAASKIQNKIRRYLFKKRLKAALKNWKYRKNVIKELLETEINYYNNLQTIEILVIEPCSS